MENTQYEWLHAETGLISEQQEGRKLTAESAKSFDHTETAKLQYVRARQRILDVNNWNKLIDGITADFRLTNQYGSLLDDLAQKGMLVRIDIPGPGTSEGNGYDWAIIEELKEGKMEDEEFIGLRIRPSSNPTEPSAEISHFFSADSTGTIILYRKGNLVTCSVYDRNLKANSQAKDNFTDRVRNTIVGSLASIGMSGIQWQKLTDTVLD
jgi:hypothetical protein